MVYVTFLDKCLSASSIVKHRYFSIFIHTIGDSDFIYNVHGILLNDFMIQGVKIARDCFTEVTHSGETHFE